MARDDFLLTPEELEFRRGKRRRLIIIVVLLVVLAIAAVFGTRPALNAAKGWQARRHAARAFEFIEQQKWTEARDAAVAGYQLRPSEPEALRAVARFLSRTQQQQALEFWDRLEQVQPLTRDDLRDEAGIALRLGERSRAAAAVQQLLDSRGGGPAAADWLLAAQVAAQDGRHEEAAAHLERILADPAAPERQKLQAVLLRLSIPSPDTEAARAATAAAWHQLVQLSRSPSDAGLDALLILAQQAAARTGAQQAAAAAAAQRGEQAPAPPPPPPGTEAIPPLAQLADSIEHHPLAKPPHKLLALDLRAHGDPVRGQAVIDQAIAQWRDADAAGVTALATWLNSKGEHQRLLDVVPLERALQHHDLFLQYVDALGALGRWTDIKNLLDSDRFPLELVTQRMYLARTNAQLGETTASENNWRRALEAAGADAGKLMMLADYAEKNGAMEIAAAAYERATAAAPRLRPAHQGRLRAAQRTGDTRRIHAVLADMLDIWPNDAAVRNDEAYMRLLLGPAPDQLAGMEKTALDLVAAAPASLPHRTLLALARLKQNRPADALAVYENIRVPQEALTSSSLVVHAAVLAANGHHEDARTEAAAVIPKQLLPEERALIAPLLDAPDTPDTPDTPE